MGRKEHTVIVGYRTLCTYTMLFRIRRWLSPSFPLGRGIFACPLLSLSLSLYFPSYSFFGSRGGKSKGVPLHFRFPSLLLPPRLLATDGRPPGLVEERGLCYLSVHLLLPLLRCCCRFRPFPPSLTFPSPSSRFLMLMFQSSEGTLSPRKRERRRRRSTLLNAK